MNNVFIHLGTCDTCRRVLGELGPGAERLPRRELKAAPLTGPELDALKELAGSYEALFSRRSQQIKARGLDVAKFIEEDYRKHILEHYSFLKRPVVVVNNRIFIGSAKAEVAAAKAALAG
jgi:arsenate reductase-like glutaredoxin family protein